MTKQSDLILALKCEQARRSFWCYCKLKAPDFYKESRTYLKQFCNNLQDFFYGDKKVLVINMPPRHGKSRTLTLFVQWILGKYSTYKVMTGSYNETLSTTFAKQVRDSIQEEDGIFSKVFPDVEIKYGEASMSKWALKGSEESNYLATSPTGTATGFGCNLMIIDDLIKNALEAYTQTVLEKHIEWFDNTMLQRTEKGFKIIIVMTRWAENDLAGYILREYSNDVIHVNYKAVQEDGSMLCDEVLSKEDYEFKTQKMNVDIISANYQQEPIDVKGRLYQNLQEYETLPSLYEIKSKCDVADSGDDYLSNIVYAEDIRNKKAYILDVLFTNKGQEETENLLAEQLNKWKVQRAWFESNNGGKAFARLVENKTRKLGNITTVFSWNANASNKEARILSNSTIVENNIYFPLNWKNTFKDFAVNVLGYLRAGKNKHDDGPDNLTMIAEDLDKGELEFI